MITATTDSRCYKSISEQANPKPGIVFKTTGSADLFYWSDLMRVTYKAKPDDDDRPEESIVFFFHSATVTIWGNQLGVIFNDCQVHLIDWIRVSPKEVIMCESGTIVTVIEIRDEKKQIKQSSAKEQTRTR